MRMRSGISLKSSCRRFDAFADERRIPDSVDGRFVVVFYCGGPIKTSIAKTGAFLSRLLNSSQVTFWILEATSGFP